MYFFDVGGTLAERVVDEAVGVLQALDQVQAGGEPDFRRRALTAMAHAYHSGVYVPATLDGERSLWRTLATVCLDLLPGGGAPGRVAGLTDVLAHYVTWYRPVCGMPALIDDLRNGGAPVGVISNWPPSLPAFLEHLGFGRFPVLACSGDLRCTKPDPAIFRWALDRAGVEAGRSWYVGNDPDCDYAPAIALGMQAVLWDPAGEYLVTGARRVGTVDELRSVLGLTD